MVYTRKKVKRKTRQLRKSYRKNRMKLKDKIQDLRLKALENEHKAQKKQVDTSYYFPNISQPKGNSGALSISSVSLLEQIGLNGKLTSNQPPANPNAVYKMTRTGDEIHLDNLSLKIRLMASKFPNAQDVRIAVIRSNDYRPYDFGVGASLLPRGGDVAQTTSPADNLMLNATLSNPVVADGTVQTDTQVNTFGYSTIIGDANNAQSLTTFQFLEPMWSTNSKFHYEVLHFSRHRIVPYTQSTSKFGTVGYKEIFINLKKKVNGMKITYEQGTSPTQLNNAWEVSKNNIFLVMWSDVVGNAGASPPIIPPTAEVLCRTKFYD